MDGAYFPSKARNKIVRGLTSIGFKEQRAQDIAFHLMDCNADVAFITALTLYPEKFTFDDINKGIAALLVHAPNHLAAAAKLYGTPVADVFGLGVLGKRSKPNKSVHRIAKKSCSR